VDLSQNGDEALAWKSNGSLRIIARRWRVDSGWQDEEILRQFAASAFGVWFLELDAKGDGFAVWGTPAGISTFEVRRLRRDQGWQQPVVFGDGKQVVGAGDFALNELGAALSYVEQYDVFDGQYYNTFTDLLVTRFVDETVPVEIALASFDVTAAGVRLRWFSPDRGFLVATVYRSHAGADWIPIGTTSPDGTGMMVFDDTDVDPGNRYGYRLGIFDGGMERHVGEVWVDVPSLTFALDPIRPNPVQGSAFSVSFVLPDAQPVRFELLDVAGRRRWTREIGDPGPGRHTIAVNKGAGSLASGLYFARLIYGGRTDVRRVVVME